MNKKLSESAMTMIAMVGLFSVFAFATLGSPASAEPETDRCFSESGEDEFGIPFLGSTCADKSMEGSKEALKEEKDECKEGDDKCSSSQTGFGAFGNWYKKGEVDVKD